MRLLSPMAFCPEKSFFFTSYPMNRDAAMGEVLLLAEETALRDFNVADASDSWHKCRECCSCRCGCRMPPRLCLFTSGDERLEEGHFGTNVVEIIDA